MDERTVIAAASVVNVQPIFAAQEQVR